MAKRRRARFDKKIASGLELSNLEFALFRNRQGYPYFVVRNGNGEFHVFAEVEAMSAAKDCGEEQEGSENTQFLWERLWKSRTGS